jgi:hypothetical protein
MDHARCAVHTLRCATLHAQWFCLQPPVLQSCVVRPVLRLYTAALWRAVRDALAVAAQEKAEVQDRAEKLERRARDLLALQGKLSAAAARKRTEVEGFSAAQSGERDLGYTTRIGCASRGVLWLGGKPDWFACSLSTVQSIGQAASWGHRRYGVTARHGHGMWHRRRLCMLSVAGSRKHPPASESDVTQSGDSCGKRRELRVAHAQGRRMGSRSL